MAFWLTGILLTALTLAALLVPMYRRRGTASTPTAVGITAVLIGLPVCVVLIYRLIGDYPSAILARAAPASVATTPQGIPAIGEMVTSLATRLKQNPDDLEGWLMLGRSYVSLEQFDAAREAYQRAYLMTGGQNLTAALGYAEAMALTDRATLSGEAGVLIEAALKTAPQNPKALWYGGMSAVAQGDSVLAAERWRRLLNQDLPDPVRQVVRQQLASLDAPMAAEPSASGPTGAGMVIAVEITVAENLRGQVDSSAPVFIVARDPDQAGPPIAVVNEKSVPEISVFKPRSFAKVRDTSTNLTSSMTCWLPSTETRLVTLSGANFSARERARARTDAELTVPLRTAEPATARTSRRSFGIISNSLVFSPSTSTLTDKSTTATTVLSAARIVRLVEPTVLPST